MTHELVFRAALVAIGMFAMAWLMTRVALWADKEQRREKNRTRYVPTSQRVVRDPRLTRFRVPPSDEGGMSTTRLVWHQKDNSQKEAS